jgi:holo-[acyl-carrier protein] synthase
MGDRRGIGVDVIEIERLEQALERRPRLAERLFSAGELAHAASRQRPGRHLAVRFAAKEAAVKALGIGGFRLHEVEVEGGGSEPPRLVLHGSVLEEARRQGVALEVSLSHSREIAVAAVLASRAA